VRNDGGVLLRDGKNVRWRVVYGIAVCPGQAIWADLVPLEMRGENPPFEVGYGFVSPSIFASWESSILTGRSLGRVQFLKRCGTTA
jgi:hypothetical protein